MKFLYTNNFSEEIVQLIFGQVPMEEWATQQEGHNQGANYGIVWGDPKTRNGGMAENTPYTKTRNRGKYPHTLKRGTAENTPYTKT